MKRILSFILAMIMCVSLFGAMSLSAYAGLDLSSYEAFKAQAAAQANSNIVNDELDLGKSGGGSGSSYLGSRPSASDIINVMGSDGAIKMPHADYYLSNYQTKYIFDCDYGLNVRVFRNPDNGIASSNQLPKAWHGSEVLLLAKRHDFYCIIYYTNENQVCAGWVHEDWLRSSFPGDKFSVGKKNNELFDAEHHLVRPAVEWADEFYIDTFTEYTRVYSPGDCFAMTLEYQVIGRNGKMAYGEHEVYYNTGDGWKDAGSFTVDEDLDPVRYTMYFNKPVNVKAIAVLPAARSQQGFDFRLCVPEMYYVTD